MRNRLSRVAALVSCAIPLFVASARADCPASTINGIDSTLPANSMESGTPGERHLGAYDLISGTLSASCTGLGGLRSETTARDLYRVVGIPSGQPIDVTVELTCSGIAYSSSHAPEFRWDITSGAQYASAHWGSPTFPERVLQLTTHTAGLQEFPVAWHVLAWESLDGSFAEIEGRIRFVNLPEGARVESCQGYVGSAVPTLPATWGAVKARHR